MKYQPNQNNMIRYNNNVADGVFFLIFDQYTITLKKENEDIVWSKRFKQSIKNVRQNLGNFSSIAEQIVVEFENQTEVIYTTNGSLLYNSEGESTYFNNYNEEFVARVIYSSDQNPGLYKLTCNIETDISLYELFDTRGMCIYQGNESSIEVFVQVLDYELLQLKTRDAISIGNVIIEPVEQGALTYVVGDSTLTNQSLPFWGWPQLLQARTQQPTINYAISARSTNSFEQEGRFKKLFNKFKAGDILIIGFGHNDEKPNYFGTTTDEYIKNIRKLITEVEQRDGKVIVVTPIARRTFLDQCLVETHDPYISKLRLEFNDYLIDNNKFTKNLILDYGVESSKELFVHSELLKVYDDTHTSYIGANLICDFFINQLKS